MSLPFLTSAPGKVIILVNTLLCTTSLPIAASVSALRTYLLISGVICTQILLNWTSRTLALIISGPSMISNAITEDQVNSQKIGQKAQQATDGLS
nr:BPK_HP1_G0043520.mRNA.1.CDS.1 [Saccharomyces cerevisiae]